MAPIIGIMASQISGHLFNLTGSYDSLATVTVPSGGAASLTFAGIPTGYRHLQVRYNANASAPTDVTMRFNSDSGSNYSSHLLRGQGTAAQSYAYPSQSYATVQFNIGYANSAAVIDILDYQSLSKNKTIRSFAGWDSNGNGNIDFWGGAWYSTNAINSITLLTASAPTFIAGSQFALYGIK